MEGYKVFDPDFTCRGFQYAVGKTYEMELNPDVCNHGFHFCKKAVDCFGYYSFNPANKVAEVIALGAIAEEGDKCATNKIQIVREIPWTELLDLINAGKSGNATGNSGNQRGNRNTGGFQQRVGNRNSGNRNSGYANSGDSNSGNRNSGNRNSGYFNSGYSNRGDFCTGDFNTTDHETGFLY